MNRIADAHCHFFSSRFLELLAQSMPDLSESARASALAARLEWTDPGSPASLADTWLTELDRHEVDRVALIASIPGDEDSVAEAVRLHPERFVGFFMLNPTLPGSEERLERAFTELALRCVCLFPAMHRYRLDDDRVVRVFESAAKHERAVFVHCGVLTVGVRARLGLPSPFDLRLGDPLAVSAVASRFPTVPVIIPHFGAGLFREALMAADQCSTISFDTSSSNGWIKYYPGLTLEAVYSLALSIVGAQRLLFGTDSSFFPRGWQRGVYETQRAALDRLGVSAERQALIFGGNFRRLFK